MPKKIFLSYRRDDAAAQARNLFDRLGRAFGSSNVFMDVDQLRAGQRFDRELQKALGACGVLLAVIGPRWAAIMSERQAGGEQDFVVDEIGAAINRDVMVVPVLVEGAQLPRADQVPEAIRNLVLHQAHRLTHERFGRDMEDLIEAIADADNGVMLVKSRRVRGLMWTAATCIGLAGVGSTAWYLPQIAALFPATGPSMGLDRANNGGPTKQTAVVAAPAPKSEVPTKSDVLATPDAKAVPADALAAAPKPEPPPAPARVVTTAADVVEKVAPAVVAITVQKKPVSAPAAKAATAADNKPLSAMPEEFREFFRNLPKDPGGQAKGSSETASPSAHGSGFVVSKDGYLVTTASVVKDAQSIRATLSNDIGLDAIIVGIDTVHDIAVLHVKSSTPLPWLAFAGRVPVAGEQALLIGNPLGLEGSVREIEVAGITKVGSTFDEIELVGAAIRGENGAPLFDLDGEVVGVVRGMRQEGNAGSSKAIALPGHLARLIVDQLIGRGAITDRAKIDVEAQRTRQLARAPSRQLAGTTGSSMAVTVQHAVVSVVEAPASAPARDGTTSPAPRRALGTLVSADGYVAIAMSMIDPTRSLTVATVDGSTYAASIAGVDARTGVVLLKINAPRRFPYLLLDPMAPRNGDVVLGVMGDAPASVTLRPGLVAHAARGGVAEGPYDLLQTSLAMRPGHSGPVLSREGRVLGLSLAIYPPTGEPVGILLAIPALTLAKVIDQLKTRGSVARGWLGVKIQNLDADMAKSFGMPDTAGAILQEVTPNGPAEVHGLRSEDVVVSIDGTNIKDTRDLALRVAEFSPETWVELGIWRRDKALSVKVKLGTFPAAREPAKPDPTENAPAEPKKPAAASKRKGNPSNK